MQSAPRPWRTKFAAPPQGMPRPRSSVTPVGCPVVPLPSVPVPVAVPVPVVVAVPVAVPVPVEVPMPVAVPVLVPSWPPVWVFDLYFAFVVFSHFSRLLLDLSCLHFLSAPASFCVRYPLRALEPVSEGLGVAAANPGVG